MLNHWLRHWIGVVAVALNEDLKALCALRYEGNWTIQISTAEWSYRGGAMPVDLDEKLSEFSYGFGLTRAVQRRLKAQGLNAVPFFPNLKHEAKLGFDVGFKRPGIPLLLQFKLGQVMQRLSPGPRPAGFTGGFWRFKVNTLEPGGQFGLLLTAERTGADVYYAAPKFHDWLNYFDAFQGETLITDSVFVTPLNIDHVIGASGKSHGDHKVIYDKSRAYLCTEPARLKVTEGSDIALKARDRVLGSKVTLASRLEDLYDGFASNGLRDVDAERTKLGVPSDKERRRRRSEIFNRYFELIKSRERALAATVAAEAWSIGAEMIFVTAKPKGA